MARTKKPKQPKEIIYVAVSQSGFIDDYDTDKRHLKKWYVTGKSGDDKRRIFSYILNKEEK